MFDFCINLFIDRPFYSPTNNLYTNVYDWNPGSFVQWIQTVRRLDTLIKSAYPQFSR